MLAIEHLGSGLNRMSSTHSCRFDSVDYLPQRAPKSGHRIFSHSFILDPGRNFIYAFPRYRCILSTSNPSRYLKTGVPCLVHCIAPPKLVDGVFSVELEPLGYERRPSEEADLRHALRAVLQALQGMHQAGFVHRDVRWPNILREPLQVSEARWPSPPPSARHYLHSAGE